MFRPSTGLIAGLALSSAFYFCMMSHAATPDATLLFFTVLTFFFVWFGATSHDALAVLTGGAKATPGQAAFTVIGLVAFFLVLTYIAKIARGAIARGEPPVAALAPHEER